LRFEKRDMARPKNSLLYKGLKKAKIDLVSVGFLKIDSKANGVVSRVLEIGTKDGLYIDIYIDKKSLEVLAIRVNETVVFNIKEDKLISLNSILALIVRKYQSFLKRKEALLQQMKAPKDSKKTRINTKEHKVLSMKIKNLTKNSNKFLIINDKEEFIAENKSFTKNNEDIKIFNTLKLAQSFIKANKILSIKIIKV